MAEIIKVSKLLGEAYPKLDVCSDNGSPIKVLQWQCHGELTVCEHGVILEEDSFIRKAQSFIDLAKEHKPELVLTPEYSFPSVVLDKIVGDKNLWPDKGKLWCLGIQGDSLECFRNKIDEWTKKKDIYIVSDAIDAIQESTFISALMYLFVLNDERLCVIPQFKTGQARDEHNQFEGPNLSLGKIIYVFNNGSDAPYQNAFLSIICADLLHINVQEILDEVIESSVLIFHPQLNPNPRFEEFRVFRKTLFRREEREIRIITLNWASDTSITGTSIRFNRPWSAFYKKFKKSITDPSFMSIINKNHKKGTAFTYDNPMEIWYSHRYEHCKLFLISKGYSTSHPAAIGRDEPETLGCYTFDDSIWVQENELCCSNVMELFTRTGIQNSFPYPICMNGGSCDRCKKSDFFFGSLLGHFDEGELKSSYEIVERFLVGSDEESDEKRDDKLDMFLVAKKLLDDGYIPQALNYLNKNYKFEISDEFISNRGEIYNVVPINTDVEGCGVDPQVLAVICKYTTESKVEVLLKKLTDRISSRYRNQILIYYRTPGNGYLYYDRHLLKSSITKPEFTDNIASYKPTRESISRY